MLKPEAFGLTPQQLQVVVIAPMGPHDTVGVVTALEGPPLLSGDIASRLGGYADVVAVEQSDAPTNDAEIIEMLLGSKNHLHNNYQDFQLFLDAGGKIGLQHDPLLYGAYLLNPFLVQVELVPMLVVNQGEVAVVKAYVGLPTSDTSGTDFKFGSIVRPGHRGIWQEPLRTGKYPINPRCYAAEIVPTSILTLNWSRHRLAGAQPRREPRADRGQEPRGFRVPHRAAGADPRARHQGAEGDLDGRHDAQPRQRGVAVGGRATTSGTRCRISKRCASSRRACRCSRPRFTAVTQYLGLYEVETKGVYIQDVVFPPELVTVLTKREIANQEKATFAEEERAETARVEMEKAKGTADMQAQLAQSQVSIDIRKNEAAGHAKRRRRVKRPTSSSPVGPRRRRSKRSVSREAKATEALGLARAEGFKAQKIAVGEMATALVAIANAVADGHITVVPEVLVTGGGGAFEGLAATLMRTLHNGDGFGGGGVAVDTGGPSGGSAVGAGDGESVAAVEAPAPPVATEPPPMPPDDRPGPGRDN